MSDQDDVAYVYENVTGFQQGWITGFIQYDGYEVRRPRDDIAYLYENVT